MKVFYTIVIFATVLLAGCGGDGQETGEETVMVIEEAGAIDPGDLTDPNHMDLPYDRFEFEAGPGDVVTMNASTEGFSPLLKLVEVETGAPLAEWDAEYPSGDALEYRIAASGQYEARIYATGGNTGSYEVTISISKE